MTDPAKVRAISSRDNPLLQRARKLADDGAAYRKLNELWLAGDHLCAAWLQRGGAAPHAVITEAAWAQPRLRALAQQAGTVSVVPDGLMADIGGLESPVPLGFVVPWSGPGEIAPGEPTVVLDRLQDAGNVGAIIRSAAAFGITQIVALKGTAAVWSQKVLRAAMGAHFGLHLVEGVRSDELSWIDALKLPLLGTSSHVDARIDRTDLPWPCAWVFGHEGQGVGAALAARCDRLLGIPQPGGEESLNVAAAAAVCLYESARQRIADG